MHPESYYRLMYTITSVCIAESPFSAWLTGQFMLTRICRLVATSHAAFDNPTCYASTSVSSVAPYNQVSTRRTQILACPYSIKAHIVWLASLLCNCNSMTKKFTSTALSETPKSVHSTLVSDTKDLSCTTEWHRGMHLPVKTIIALIWKRKAVNSTSQH